MRQPGARADNQLREITITPGYLDFADGSCLITWGRTRVICAATVTEQVPPFRLASGGGWVTGEYAMLPRAGWGAAPWRSSASSAAPLGRRWI
jgi:ribonuclease PH